MKTTAFILRLVFIFIVTAVAIGCIFGITSLWLEILNNKLYTNTTVWMASVVLVATIGTFALYVWYMWKSFFKYITFTKTIVYQ